MVRKDSPIKTIEDLKGKAVASNVEGQQPSTWRSAAMVVKHGLGGHGRNVTFVEVGFPNMKAGLLEKKVDLISAVRPFSADPELRAAARTLFFQRQAIGRSEMIINVAKGEFIKTHRAALVDFLEDELRAQRWILDPANHDAAVKLLADYSKHPVAAFQSWAFTKGDFFHDPNGLPDMTALQSNIDLQHKLGFVKASIDAKKYSDLALVKEAAARLNSRLPRTAERPSPRSRPSARGSTRRRDLDHGHGRKVAAHNAAIGGADLLELRRRKRRGRSCTR